jgi:hypothetical protein
MKGGQGAGGLAQATFGAVAHHRAADPARGGEADADEGLAVGAIAQLGQDGAAGAGQALGGGQEVGPLLQAFDLGDGFGQAETL